MAAHRRLASLRLHRADLRPWERYDAGHGDRCAAFVGAGARDGVPEHRTSPRRRRRVPSGPAPSREPRRCARSSGEGDRRRLRTVGRRDLRLARQHHQCHARSFRPAQPAVVSAIARERADLAVCSIGGARVLASTRRPPPRGRALDNGVAHDGGSAVGTSIFRARAGICTGALPVAIRRDGFVDGAGSTARRSTASTCIVRGCSAPWPS